MSLFISMLLLVFAIGTMIAGLFTIYFGSGRSRTIGGMLFLIGIIMAAIFYNYSGGELWGNAGLDLGETRACRAHRRYCRCSCRTWRVSRRDHESVNKQKGKINTAYTMNITHHQP